MSSLQPRRWPDGSRPSALAAHQIALNIAAFTFMVPLGVASAGAVRVGHAVGRRDRDGAARSGWTALLFGAGFMSCAALAFLLIPRTLIGAFTSDAGVLDEGVTLLSVAAIFQLFDGIQGVATGVLRGLGDTRTPMLWNLAGHWAIGLPLGYTLCFIVGLGVVGLWWGLSTGLIICGVALLVVWAARIRSPQTILHSTRGSDALHVLVATSNTSGFLGGVARRDVVVDAARGTPTASSS